MATYLLNYKVVKFDKSSYDFLCNLFVVKKYFFGVIQVRKEINYTIPAHARFANYFTHWDNIIEKGRPLNIKTSDEKKHRIITAGEL